MVRKNVHERRGYNGTLQRGRRGLAGVGVAVGRRAVLSSKTKTTITKFDSSAAHEQLWNRMDVNRTRIIAMIVHVGVKPLCALT